MLKKGQNILKIFFSCEWMINATLKNLNIYIYHPFTRKKDFQYVLTFFKHFFVEKKTEKYVPSEQLKADQTDVDAQVIAAIKATKDRKTLFGYLWTILAL